MLWHNRNQDGVHVLRTTTIAAFFATTGWGCAENKVDSVYGDTGNNLLHNPGPEHIDGDDCTELTVEAGGRNLDNIAEPEVGDVWELRMFCDGVLMTGANLLKFTPPNVAVVDTEMTNATFVTAGEATMLLQSGNIQYFRDLVVQQPQ